MFNAIKFKRFTALLVLCVMFVSVNLIPVFADSDARHGIDRISLDEPTSSDIGETSVRIEAYIYFYGGPDEDQKDDYSFKIEYSKNSNFDNYKSTVVSRSGNTISQNITGLDENTRYYFRVTSSYNGSENGSSRDSNSINVTTGQLQETPSVKTDSATLNGDRIIASGTSESNYNIGERGFVYSTSRKEPTINNDKVVISTTSSGRNQFTSDINLDSDVSDVYYVRAYAKVYGDNNKQYVGYGNTLTVNVASERPTVKLSKISNITADSADITIDVTKKGNGELSERGIVYSKEKSKPEVGEKDCYKLTYFGSTGSRTETLENLDPDTKYYVRAFARNQSGTSYSDVSDFKTVVDEVKLTVKYQVISSSIISQEVITTKVGKTLRPADLNIPSGYKLLTEDWKFDVKSGSTETIVLIKPIEDKKPDPEPKPDEKLEKEFMPSVGGYKFAPEQNTTRAEVAQILYNLSDDKNYTPGASFPDVPNNFATKTASKTAIDFVAAKGYMNGYENGKFGPNDNLTRAQVATVLCNFYGLNGYAPSPFPDTKGHWGESFISLAASAKMITGYSNGNFGPDDPATRAQACQLFYNAEDRSGAPLSTATFLDVPSEYWGYKAIMNSSLPTP